MKRRPGTRTDPRAKLQWSRDRTGSQETFEYWARIKKLGLKQGIGIGVEGTVGYRVFPIVKCDALPFLSILSSQIPLPFCTHFTLPLQTFLYLIYY
jgi:hypothetical protein